MNAKNPIRTMVLLSAIGGTAAFALLQGGDTFAQDERPAPPLRHEAAPNDAPPPPPDFEPRAPRPDRAASTFDGLDRDGDGTISRDEFNAFRDAAPERQRNRDREFAPRGDQFQRDYERPAPPPREYGYAPEGRGDFRQPQPRGEYRQRGPREDFRQPGPPPHAAPDFRSQRGNGDKPCDEPGMAPPPRGQRYDQGRGPAPRGGQFENHPPPPPRDGRGDARPPQAPRYY